jgi:hypothetical protein
MTARPRLAALEHGVFGIYPVLMTVAFMIAVIHSGQAALDFRHDFWIAGDRVLHGLTPYTWTHREILDFTSFPYLAPVGLFFAPFALIPSAVGGAIFTALCMLALLGALRVLGVTDWRIYGLVFLWCPVVNAWQTANVTLPLLFGIACVWRWRDRPARAGLAFALCLCLKAIVWPLGLWLLATRRYRAAAIAAAWTVAINAAGWSVLGFDQIHRWLHLTELLQRDILYRSGYALLSLLTHLGLARGAGTAVVIALSVAGAAAVVWVARHDGEERALCLSVALMLVAAPFADSHYLTLLIVPLAILRPRLHPLWAVPLLFWACPSEPSTLELAVAWAVVAAVVHGLMRRPRPGTARQLEPAPRAPLLKVRGA